MLAIGGNTRVRKNRAWTEKHPTNNARYGSVAVRIDHSKCMVINGDRHCRDVRCAHGRVDHGEAD